MTWTQFEPLIAEFVRGRLEEPLQSRFEESLLANPEWAQWVAAEELLRDGLRDLAKDEPELFDPARRPR